MTMLPGGAASSCLHDRGGRRDQTPPANSCPTHGTSTCTTCELILDRDLNAARNLAALVTAENGTPGHARATVHPAASTPRPRRRPPPIALSPWAPETPKAAARR